MMCERNSSTVVLCSYYMRTKCTVLVLSTTAIMNYTTKNLYNVPMRCDPIVNISCMYYTTENLSLEMHFSHNNALVDKKLLLYWCRK